MKRIGITIDLKTSLWANGINQNAIYFANLVKEIGYMPYLIHNIDQEVEDINGIKAINLKKSEHVPFHLVVQFSFIITAKMFSAFKIKNKNVKLVSYKCGNEFIIDMESILFNSHEKRTDSISLNKTNPFQIPDVIWSIPQMETSNLQYYKFTNKQEKATVVPFIWEPLAIEDYCKDHRIGVYKNRDINRIGVLEPNISVMKNVLLPIAIIESYYKKNKNISKVRLFSSEKLKENKRLLQIIEDTEIYKDKLVSAESRFPIAKNLNEFTDIVVSWQWENNLNYLWLDVAWLGWPIVHNGSLCQDIGYYYTGFEINDGVLKIEEAIKNHNKDSEYLQRNRDIIKRYTHKNEKLKEQYKVLIDNVLENKFKQYTYDWKTNSIDL